MIVCGCHLCIVSCFSLLRLSSVSVVFDFNASTNDVAPVSPILLSVGFMRMKKERIVVGCYLC